LDTDAAARRWADTWQRGWNEFDVEGIVALYAPDAIVSIEAFRDPSIGPAGVRRYLARTFAEEERVEATFAEPVVGDGRAAVSWWATMVENGAPVTLAGTSMLRFNDEGLVVEQWDAWNQSAGNRKPGVGFPA
jgi:SnoaL-like domain